MAKVTNLIFQGASGRMGDIVFATRKGKTYMRFAPARRANNKPSSKQLQVLNNFKEASLYAGYITQNPELAKIYEAHKRKGKSVFSSPCRTHYVRPL